MSNNLLSLTRCVAQATEFFFFFLNTVADQLEGRVYSVKSKEQSIVV